MSKTPLEYLFILISFNLSTFPKYDKGIDFFGYKIEKLIKKNSK